jgi:hypothetical protein
MEGSLLYYQFPHLRKGILEHPNSPYGAGIHKDQNTYEKNHLSPICL